MIETEQDRIRGITIIRHSVRRADEGAEQSVESTIAACLYAAATVMMTARGQPVSAEDLESMVDAAWAAMEEESA